LCLFLNIFPPQKSSEKKRNLLADGPARRHRLGHLGRAHGREHGADEEVQMDAAPGAQQRLEVRRQRIQLPNFLLKKLKKNSNKKIPKNRITSGGSKVSGISYFYSRFQSNNIFIIFLNHF
jgi:hypothetical protein